MPQVLEQKVLQSALKLGRYGVAKILNIFPRSFAAQIAIDIL